MPDIKMFSTQPGIDPGFTHLQDFVVATRPSCLHLLLTPCLILLNSLSSRVELIKKDALH